MKDPSCDITSSNRRVIGVPWNLRLHLPMFLPTFLFVASISFASADRYCINSQCCTNSYWDFSCYEKSVTLTRFPPNSANSLKLLQTSEANAIVAGYLDHELEGNYEVFMYTNRVHYYSASSSSSQALNHIPCTNHGTAFCGAQNLVVPNLLLTQTWSPQFLPDILAVWTLKDQTWILDQIVVPGLTATVDGWRWYSYIVPKQLTPTPASPYTYFSVGDPRYQPRAPSFESYGIWHGKFEIDGRASQGVSPDGPRTLDFAPWCSFSTKGEEINIFYHDASIRVVITAKSITWDATYSIPLSQQTLSAEIQGVRFIFQITPVSFYAISSVQPDRSAVCVISARRLSNQQPTLPPPPPPPSKINIIILAVIFSVVGLGGLIFVIYVVRCLYRRKSLTPAAPEPLLSNVEIDDH